MPAAGCGAHAIAVRPLDDAGGGGEGGPPNGIVFGSGPKAQDHKIRLLVLPPGRVANIRRGGPEDRAWGWLWWMIFDGLSRMNDEGGVMSEVTKGDGQKPQIPVPEEFLRPNGKIGVEKNLQISAR